MIIIILHLLVVFFPSALGAPVKRPPVVMDFSIVQKPRNKDVQDKSIGDVDDVLVQLENKMSLYVTELVIGTPGQTIKCSLDTGSSDMWVPSYSSFNDLPFSPQYGAFNASASKSYRKYRDNFSIIYGDGTSATGEWGTDSLKINEMNVKNAVFGLATQQTTGFGVLGLGFKENESSSWILKESGNSNNTFDNDRFQEGFYYDNYPILLKKNGYIDKLCYSLYLGATDSKKGQILFGAIDVAKFDDMVMLDILKIDAGGSSLSETLSFYVQLDDLTIGDNKFMTKPQVALLDSGSSIVFAPADITKAIQSKYGKYNPQLRTYSIPCDAKLPNFKFTFKNKTISIPFSDMLVQTPASDVSCTLAVQSSNFNYFILGDTFLRSTYVLHDLEDSKVGIAQAIYTNKTDIVFL